VIIALSQTAVSFIGVGIGVFATFLFWVIDRYDPIWAIRHIKDQKLSGKWHGWSVYIPVEGFFSRDSEAIYQTVVDFRQRGRRVTFQETLTHIYDINGAILGNLAARHFSGQGRIDSDFDISARLKEQDGLTIGSMHIVVDWRANELTGILAVRPQIPGRPVAVKILLRRVGETVPTWDDLGLPLLQELARNHDRRHPQNT
jgi:hypothetical protein